MKNLTANVAYAAVLKKVIETHMTEPQYAIGLPLYVPVITGLMDTAPSQTDRAQMFGAAATAFLSESTPALRDFNPETVDAHMDQIFVEMQSILDQVREKVIGSKDMHDLIKSNRQTNYVSDNGEQAETEDNDKSDGTSVLDQLLSALSADGCGECEGCKRRAALKEEQEKGAA